MLFFKYHALSDFSSVMLLFWGAPPPVVGVEGYTQSWRSGSAKTETLLPQFSVFDMFWLALC